MALEITGTVKQGTTPIEGEVKLQILDKSHAVWGSEVPIVRGEFEISIQDATGSYHNYKGMTLEGQVIQDEKPHPGLVPQKVLIPGDKVQLHFVLRDRVTLKDLLIRMARAAALQRATYALINVDAKALPQSLAVSAAASIALGGALGWGGGLGDAAAATGFVLVVLAILGGLMFVLGTKLLHRPTTQTTLPQFLRTLGFATTPLLCVALLMLLLQAVGSLGALNALFMVAVVWTLLAMTVAVRESLSYYDQWWRALCVVLVPVVLAVAAMILRES